MKKLRQRMLLVGAVFFWIAFVGFFTSLFFIGRSVGEGIEQMYNATPGPYVPCTIVLPDESGQIIVSVQHLPGFTAEYFQRLQFTSADGTVIESEPEFIDSGAALRGQIILLNSNGASVAVEYRGVEFTRRFELHEASGVSSTEESLSIGTFTGSAFQVNPELDETIRSQITSPDDCLSET